MPGRAAIFSELTIMFIYGKSGEGKTTFAKYITENKGSIISMDEMTIRSFNKYPDIMQKNMVSGIVLNRQIGVVIDKLSDNSIIVNSIIETTMNEISRLQEIYKDIKIIVLEGYTLSKENILEILIKSIKDKNMRYWICHK